MTRVWLAVALVGLAVCATVSAKVAWQKPGTIPAVRVAVPLPVAVPAERAAPAKGVTGTTALPMLPTGIGPSLDHVGIVAALPFAAGRASAVDRARALQCLASAIYYEAASESDAGQYAVAQVVLNRVRHPAFPATVCGVVYQGSEKAVCQFSFACDGAAARIPAPSGWARALRHAAAALAGYVYAPVGLATHYHTYAVTPAWNRSLVMTDMVGAHFFHRWKGYWGTARAFSQSYRGGEPSPAPDDRVLPTLPAATAAPIVQTVAATTPQGAAAIAPPSPTDRLPESGQILDRWKDAGQPLDQ